MAAIVPEYIRGFSGDVSGLIAPDDTATYQVDVRFWQLTAAAPSFLYNDFATDYVKTRPGGRRYRGTIIGKVMSNGDKALDSVGTSGSVTLTMETSETIAGTFRPDTYQVVNPRNSRQGGVWAFVLTGWFDGDITEA